MANTPFKYLLFDWDGTLLNSLPSWILGARSVLKKYDLDTLSDRDIALHVINNLHRVHEYYPTVDSVTFRDEVLDVDCVVNLHLSPLHEGVEDTLAFLKKKNIPMGIVTTSDRQRLQNSLAHHKLEKYFDILIAQEDVTNLKPHPEPILKGIEKLQAVAASTIYIGDSLHDVHAGRSAGIRTALHFPLLSYYDESFYDESGADYILRQLDEIHRLCM